MLRKVEPSSPALTNKAPFLSKIKIFSLISLLFPPFISALILVLSFPTFDIGWLAWFGLVPLLVAISGRSPAYGFFSFFIYGFLFFSGVCSWLYEVDTFRIVHHIIIMTYLGLYFGFFGLTFNFISKKWGATTAHTTAPFVWVSIEYIRSNMSFLALPWGLLAHTQYQHPSIMQVSSITGAYGLSFSVFMVNSTLASVTLIFLARSRLRKKQPGYEPPSRRGVFSMVLASVILTGLILFQGRAALSKPITGEKLKLSILQGNIGQDQKWNPKYKNYIMQTYTDLSIAAAKDRPDLIIWPEAATPRYVLKNPSLLKQIKSIIGDAKTSFLIGSAEYAKSITKKPSNRVKIGNTALFFSPTGTLLDTYLKIHLVPFGEYVPYPDIIPWPDFIAVQGNSSSDLPGEKHTIFELDGNKFGTVICWESIFPGLFRKFVKNGAGFMINITNEGWFRHKIPHQYVAMNVFRAVENRVYLARAANTGVSCFIDPFGRITGRVERDGKDTYVRGYLTREITVSKEKTFYTEYGDVFVYLCILVSCLMVVVSFFKSRNFHSS
jgi:apolipoprotein N-acyltransferase